MRTFSHTTREGNNLPVVVDFIVEKVVGEVTSRVLIATNTDATSWPCKGDFEFMCGNCYLVDSVIGYNEECKYEVILTQPESK